MNNQEFYESVICRYIRGTPGAMYDIGVGPKSEWRTLGRKYPGMRIFGCEPNPVQYERLLKVPFPGPLASVAIGEHEGVGTLHYNPADPKCSTMHAVSYATTRRDVKVWSLDRFDDNMGNPDRILLWMDIEGSELSALRSGPKLMASGRVRWINLEEVFQPKVPGWCDRSDVHKVLTSHGYRRVATYNRHPTHQDVIYLHQDERR